MLVAPAMSDPPKRTQWREDLQNFRRDHGFSRKVLLNCCLVRRVIAWATPNAKGRRFWFTPPGRRSLRETVKRRLGGAGIGNDGKWGKLDAAAGSIFTNHSKAWAEYGVGAVRRGWSSTWRFVLHLQGGSSSLILRSFKQEAP